MLLGLIVGRLSLLGCLQAEWGPSHGKRGAEYTESGGVAGEGTNSVKDTVRASHGGAMDPPHSEILFFAPSRASQSWLADQQSVMLPSDMTLQ